MIRECKAQPIKTFANQFKCEGTIIKMDKMEGSINKSWPSLKLTLLRQFLIRVEVEFLGTQSEFVRASDVELILI
jgi:hypothetical protein